MELLLLFISAVTGGCLAWLVRIDKNNMKLILSFSGAFMLGLSFFHVLPEAYEELGRNAGIWVLVGFMTQIILEVLSKGLEHGHAHIQHGHGLPVALLVGLSVHAFIEGMPFGGVHHGEQNMLLIGVILHKLPVAFILGTVLRSSGYSLLRTTFALVGFAAMAPLGGAVPGLLDVAHIDIPNFQGVALALLVGVFLHIATTIIFESDKGHSFNLSKLIAILIGFSLAYLSL